MAKQQPPPKTVSRFATGVEMIGRFIVGSSIPEILLLATLAMARYVQNSDFSYPSEIVLNVVLLGIIASGAFYGFRLVLRGNLLGAHVAGLLFAYMMYGYTYAFTPLRNGVNTIIPDGATPFTTAVLSILLYAIVFGLAGFVVSRLSRLPQLRSLPLLKFFVFVIAFVFVSQLYKTGVRVWDIRQDLAYTQPTSQLQKAATGKATDKPNVYYLILDRYASAETLRTVYDYDNTPFLNSLRNQGFFVRDNAYANYPFTMQSVSSTLSADYHTDLAKQFATKSPGFQTGFPYRQALDYSPVASAFKGNGYQYNQVSSWWDFSRMNPYADTNPSKSFRLRVFGKNFWLTDLQRDIVNKSILSPLLLKGVTIGNTTAVQYQLDRNPSQNFFSQIKALEAIATTKAAKPQFTLAHILSPHDPYVFDTDGSSPSYDPNRTDNGIDEYQKYVNQLTYVNSQYEKMIQNIRKNDPTAVVLIQADEGPYPKQFRGTLSQNNFYDPAKLPLAAQRQKTGIMAAYYLPGVSNELAAQNMTSSVNTFRFVLNQYLGYRLPLLADCNYSAGNKYSVYNFTLIGDKLKDAPNPTGCSPR